jgi:hypothetical protein
MGMVVDCSTEFLIRQQVNRVRQIAESKGFADRVMVTIEPDETTDTGYGIVLYDKATHEKMALNMDLFTQKEQVQ